MTNESETMDEETTPRAEAPPPRASWKATVLACAAIALVAGGITVLTFSTEPTAEREGARRQTAMLAEVTVAERGSYRPEFVSTGVVRAQQEIELSPRVSGEIVRRAPEFSPGRTIEKGQMLLQIDPADYRHALEQQRGQLRQALTDLEIEMGQQHVARQDYELLDRELPQEQEALVLRKPQLQAAEQRVEAARAAVSRAELDLERTTIRAPFAAHILSRDVNVGSQVAPGDTLARLVGVDAYWVIATFSQPVLRWLAIPRSPDEEGSRARVRNRSAWPEGVYREGTLRDRVGALDGETRMARVLIEIRDPLAIGDPATPALMIEEFLEVRLTGEKLDDVVRLSREHIRDDDTVWVMDDDDKLRIVEVEIAVRDAEYAYITGGLRGGESIVTSNLATVTDGAALRVSGDGEGASGG